MLIHTYILRSGAGPISAAIALPTPSTQQWTRDQRKKEKTKRTGATDNEKKRNGQESVLTGGGSVIHVRAMSVVRT